MLPSHQVGSSAKASDRAYALLRQMIVSLKLEPGSPVDEKGLSINLGLGRTPVREALLKLADKKLVQIMPRKGTYVRPIRLQDLRNVEELRWYQESLAARWAAERISEAELSQLESLIENAEAGTFSDIEDWDVEVDRSFHSLLATASRNPFLEESLGLLYDHSVRMLYFTRVSMAPAVEELPDYRFIISALRAGDADQAERGMQRHLRASREQLAQSIETNLISELPASLETLSYYKGE